MCSTTSNSSPPLSNRISIKTTPCRRHTWCFGFNYIIMQTDAFHLHVFASYICKQRMSSGADSFCYTCRGATCSVLTHHYDLQLCWRYRWKFFITDFLFSLSRLKNTAFWSLFVRVFCIPCNKKKGFEPKQSKLL